MLLILIFIVVLMNNSNGEVSETEISSVNVEFVLLLLVELISLICTLIILIYTFVNRQLVVSKALHNHAILLIIFISFLYTSFDLPFTISSYRLGFDLYRSVTFCQWWYWIDYTLVGISLHITAVASVQRYIFIFKSYLLRNRPTRWIFHYFPLIFPLIYTSIFYFVVIYFYPCENFTDYSIELFCSSPCYSQHALIIDFDWIINSVLPMGIIIVTHTIFISWMICSMRTLTQQPRHIRRKHKKLTLQLFAFAFLFIVGWTPSTIISLASLFSFTNVINDAPGIEYFYYISYFICPLQPLICLFVLPEPAQFIFRKVRRCRKQMMKTAVIPFETQRID